MERYILEFRWRTSRGRNTYGYTICSLYVNGHKEASCNGGGYDMKGTVLGDWIASHFAEEILKLEIPTNRRNGKEIQEFYGLTFHDPNFDPGKAIIGQGCDDRTLGKEGKGKTVEQAEADGESFGLERYRAFYGASSSVPTKRHVIPLINGACGFSSVKKIVKALGFSLTYITRNSKAEIFTMTKKGE